MKYKVLITDPISESGIKLLESNNCEVIIKTDSPKYIDDIIENIDAWIIRSGTKILDIHIKKAKNLKIIGRAGVGIDNIDLDAATQHGIVVTNVPDGNSISAAEHTLAVILALSRNLHLGYDSLMKGKWDRANLIGNEIRNKTLGVVGLGKIGKEVIIRSQAFGLNVLGYDPFVDKNILNNDDVQIVSLDKLITDSDIISLHIPLNDSTKNLFDMKKLKKMKASAKIINVARGGIINEQDLASALNQNLIAGAGIDVFENEPLDKKNPLLKAKNCLLTPHLGASTYEAKEGVSKSICQQIIDFLEKNKLKSALNLPISDMSIFKKLQPFLNLAEVIGKIQSQLINSSIQKIKITCYGKFLDPKPISIAVVKGLLSNVVDDRLNYINALNVAEERGIEIINSLNNSTDKYENLVDVDVFTKNQTINIGGSVFFGKEFRILKFMKHDISFIPEGRILLKRNEDKPGVVGKIGTILGNFGVNIAEYILSRPYKNESPISIIKVDNKLNQKCLEKLNEIDEIIEVKQFKI